MSNTYLFDAVERILTGLGLLQVDGVTILKTMQLYLLPPPTSYPSVSVNIEGLRIALESGNDVNSRGSDLEYQKYSVGFRLLIGKVGSQFDSQLQRNLLVWLPTIVNYLNDNYDLVFTGEQSEIAELAPDGIQAVGATRVGEFNDGTVGLEIIVDIPFHIELED